ncbi:MAG: hypothetical protein K0R83_2517, partial [Caulobacter sp.]|jgi:hypothetical protein|nr:hypothetical protein [Caulobacter sp.]
MMKKILLTAAAVAAVAAAVPAAAQSYDRDGRGGYDQRREYRGERYDRSEFANYRWNDGSRREWRQARQIDERQARLAQRIDDAARRGALSPGEARNFFFKLRNTEQLERNYKRHNRDLTRAEVRILNYRMDLLQKEITYKIRT